MIQVQPSQYAGLQPLLRSPRLNLHFARAVLEGRVTGTVHVDDPVRPKAAYILHPCGMSLLCGSAHSGSFKSALVGYMLDHARTRRSFEMAQAHPDSWHDELARLLGPRLLRNADPSRRGLDHAGVQTLGNGRVIEWVRLNFEFDRAAFEAAPDPLLEAGLRLGRAGRAVFRPWQRGLVVPGNFWDSPEHFERDGVAFAVFEGIRPLCVAFSAWILRDVLEIGIETCPDARRRGLASVACAALIRHALSRGLEPVWSAHLDNHASHTLAARLGFKRTLQLPYYGLVANGN